MDITYDRARDDITFCTMLFKMPQAQNLDALKSMDRKFENFYLPSIKRLVETFGRVALWCDSGVADFLRANHLDSQIEMRVMDFSELPHFAERDRWLHVLESMRGNVGYFLRHKSPRQWLDYLTLIMAKPAVMNWAAAENKFGSKYFMWIDAGAFNPIYADFWAGWRGRIDARPVRCRFTVAPTLGKSRPHFVPRFVYDIYRRMAGPIPNATADLLARQNLRDIAMINADYDVPATSFMMPQGRVADFYNAFERTRRIMLRHGLVSTEQAVFQAMMKFDVDKMFEISYIHGYHGVYTAVAASAYDCLI